MKYILLITLSLLLFSCEDKVDELEFDVIINSEWVTRDEVKDFQLGGENLRYLKFTSDQDVIYRSEYNGTMNSVTVGTYVLEYPLVKITFDDETFTYEFDFNDTALISHELQHLDGEWLTYYRMER